MRKILLSGLGCIVLLSGLHWACDYAPGDNQFATDNFSPNQPVYVQQDQNVICGAERLSYYVPRLQGKKVGLVANQSSKVQDHHLLDTLLELDVDVKRVFTPEHGFRGDADAGDKIDDQIDQRSGLPLISLYGDKRRPRREDVADLDIIVFDIQDVGVRFYTFISTLHYVMDACAEYGVQLMVLDRPNPNGHYVDGPMRMEGYQSFVGMHPVPVVYGMTIGEYAQMINGEKWLDEGRACPLEIVNLKNYTHQTTYDLPIKPSPNLPNLRSIYLYPSLCFFEPTIMSIGRGTDKQFQIIGHPVWRNQEFSFTPVPKPGAMKPKLENNLCFGVDLTELSTVEIKDWASIHLEYLLGAYSALKDEGDFFTSPSFFDKLAGSDQLRNQILDGDSLESIRASWQEGLNDFMEIREKYLLYH